MPNNHQAETPANFQDYPVFNTQCSTSTGSHGRIPPDSDFYQPTSAQSSVSQYTFDMHHHVMQGKITDLEKRLAKTEQAIENDRAFERAARLTLTLNTISGILMPIFILLLIAIIFCFKAPEECFTIISKYIVTIGVGTVITIITLFNPLWHLHQYNKRLDKIEKSLHLNGND